MKADLYLFNSSFIDKDEISPDVFCDNLRELQKTILHINKINNQFPSEKDQVFRNNDIFEIMIFENITIHLNVEASLKRLEGGLEKFAETIVYNLTQLNDNFSKCNNPSDRIRTLREFSSICKVDASAEGDTRRRSSLTFEFIDEKSNPISIYCEPHLKLGEADSPGDTHFYFNRIYFHEGKPDVEGGRILVAHIGKHL